MIWICMTWDIWWLMHCKELLSPVSRTALYNSLKAFNRIVNSKLISEMYIETRKFKASIWLKKRISRKIISHVSLSVSMIPRFKAHAGYNSIKINLLTLNKLSHLASVSQKYGATTSSNKSTKSWRYPKIPNISIFCRKLFMKLQSNLESYLIAPVSKVFTRLMDKISIEPLNSRSTKEFQQLWLVPHNTNRKPFKTKTWRICFLMMTMMMRRSNPKKLINLTGKRI